MDERTMRSEPAEIDPVEALTRLEEAAVALDSGRIRGDISTLRERIDDGRFHVACVGQFKRGKSTLINALIDRAVLPTGVVPVTSVPTIIRYGPKLAVRARLRETSENGALAAVWTSIDPARVQDLVSEERNPENVNGVLAVEIFVPSELLEGGMCLVDTPGLGSVFGGSTAATRAFVPHIDAALVVLGADPPITGEELALVEEVSRHSDHLVFVLNKTDRVSDAEREEAQAFTARILVTRLDERARGIADGRVFAVSALERLEGRGPARDWDALVAALRDLSERSGRAIARDAVGRGFERLRARLLGIVDEEIAALTRPLEGSAARLEALAKRTAAAERALADLGPLFTAEQSRLSRAFAERRAAFLRETVPRATRALSERLVACRPAQARSRAHAFAIAQQVAREMLEPWLAESEAAAARSYSDAAVRFVVLANNFLRDVRAADLATESFLDLLPNDLPAEEHLRARRRFYFHEFQHRAAPAGLGPAAQRVLDVMSPRSVVARRTACAARDFVGQLLETNASRVEGDLNERLIESRRQLETVIRGALAEATEIVSQALARARASHAAGHEAVASAIQRLRLLRSQVVR